jgi:hypothetical protein
MIKMMIIVVFFFAFCWLPFNLLQVCFSRIHFLEYARQTNLDVIKGTNNIIDLGGWWIDGLYRSSEISTRPFGRGAKSTLWLSLAIGWPCRIRPTIQSSTAASTQNSDR